MQHPLTIARKLRKLSKSELARQCDLSPAAICKIENGQRAGNLFTYKKLASYLEMDYRLLLPEEKS